MIVSKFRIPVFATALAAVVVVLGMAVRPSSHVSEAMAQPPVVKSGDRLKKPPSDRQTLDYLTAMLKGDVDGVMAFWAADADYIDEAGKLTRGKEQIAAMFKKSLPGAEGKQGDWQDSLDQVPPPGNLPGGRHARTRGAPMAPRHPAVTPWYGPRPEISG